jgi:prepilin-type N-terminal cleavage/methylation domain-containing protein
MPIPMLVTDFFSDKSRSHGFTLIEIAVVLVIVTLLAIGSLQITTGLLAKQRRDAPCVRLVVASIEPRALGRR